MRADVAAVNADQLPSRGYGWWVIRLACGHQCAVLHGERSPLGDFAACFCRCGEAAPADELFDRRNLEGR